MSERTPLDYAILLGIGVLWGSSFVFNEWALQSFPPATVATGRVFIGALTLAAIAPLFPRSGGDGSSAGGRLWLLIIVIAGLEAVLPNYLVPLGQQHLDASIAAILLATVPIFTLVLAPWFVPGETWRARMALAVGLGFLGVVILVRPGASGDFFGAIGSELAVLGAALSLSLSLLLMKRLQGFPAVVAMRNIFLIGSVPLIVLSAVMDRPWAIEASATSWAALIALGILSGGFGYALFIYSVFRTGPTFTSLAGYLVTLFGVLFGIMLMGDRLGGTDIIAIGFIVVALWFARASGRQSDAR